MAELRSIPLPPHFLSIPEIAELDRVSDKFISEFYDAIEDAHDDLLITTATEAGIKWREDYLKIVPADTDSLEARRARVLMRWYDKVPYTRRVIERKIAVLCGEDNYTFEYSKSTKVLTVEMMGVGWDVIHAVQDVLEELVSLMIVLDVKQVFISSVTSDMYSKLMLLGSIEIGNTIEAEEEEE